MQKLHINNIAYKLLPSMVIGLNSFSLSSISNPQNNIYQHAAIGSMAASVTCAVQYLLHQSDVGTIDKKGKWENLIESQKRNREGISFF